MVEGGPQAQGSSQALNGLFIFNINFISMVFNCIVAYCLLMAHGQILRSQARKRKGHKLASLGGSRPQALLSAL
jgi:hypothetical protein